MKGEIYCLGFYNSKKHDSFIISITTQLLTELEIFYKVQCFIITKNMNALWELTLFYTL